MTTESEVSFSAADGMGMLVTTPGVTLKVCENEMAGSATVPVVAVIPEMNR